MGAYGPAKNGRGRASGRYMRGTYFILINAQRNRRFSHTTSINNDYKSKFVLVVLIDIDH